MGQQADGEASDGSEPPAYEPLPRVHREAAIQRTALGIITPESMADSPVEEAIDTAFADYDPEQPRGDSDGPKRGAMYFHTGWLSRERAATAVEQYPEMGKYAFYPPDVAEAIGALPETVQVVLGRERIPIVYIWTDRPPLVGVFKDAGYSGVIVEVVDEWPQVSDGECALAYNGRPGPDNDWYLVRAAWLR